MNAARPRIWPRFGPPLTLTLMLGPVVAGFAGTLLPAFGYLPPLGGETLSLGPFRRFLDLPGIGRSMLLSLQTGFGASLIALCVTALFLAAAPPRLVHRMQHVLSPLLSVPHAAAAFGIAFLVQPSGLLARLVSPELTGWTRPPDVVITNDPAGLALMLGLAAKEVPFLLLIALAALPQIPATGRARLMHAMGYGRIAAFLIGVWPDLYRQIRLGVFAVIAFSTSVVDVGLILGPSAPPVLAVRLVQAMNDPDLSMRLVAAAGALTNLGITLAAMVIWLGLERIGGGLVALAGRRGLRLRRDGLIRLSGQGLMILVAALLGGGLATLALWSFAGLWSFPDALPERIGLDTWRRIAGQVRDPFMTTLAIGLISATVATVLAVACLAREDDVVRSGQPRSESLALVYLPLIVPQVAFLFGLQILFLATGTSGHFLPVVAAHLVFVLPYVFLSLADPWRALDVRHERVAASLGLSDNAILWRIRLPMLLRPLLAAFALGFAVSAGQYLATILIGAGRLSTLTTEAVALASGGNRRIIGAYALMQMALPSLFFLIAVLIPALLWRDRRGMGRQA